ncbi:MAG: M50 family metallopeptidase [Myxococcaceae bacterium]
MPASSPLDSRRLIALVAALAVGLIFWDSPALWPLKLLVVMMHESGHALGTLLVGGSVDHVVLNANESGACLSRVPNGLLAQVVVYSSGYVGSAVAGAALLLATFRFRLRRAVLVLTCVWLAVMGVVYAGNLFTLLFCLGTAALLAVCARLLSEGAVEVMNLFTAAFSALYVVFDLRDDLWDHRVRAVSDAALLADLTWVPAVVWAVLWSLFSLTILGAAAWSAVRRQHRLTSADAFGRRRTTAGPGI